jgi:hypothetical protein
MVHDRTKRVAMVLEAIAATETTPLVTRHRDVDQAALAYRDLMYAA